MTRSSASLLSSSLLPLLLIACSGGSGSIPESTPENASSSSSSSSSGGSPADATGRNTVGIWHLQQVDATNLEIKADGTFRWSIEGCDFGGGDCGTWTLDPNGPGIVLTGKGAAGNFTWTSNGSFATAVTSLRVSRLNDASAVEIVDATKGATQGARQTWESGRVCAVCGGNLGPTGQKTCSDPLPDICASR